MSQRRPDRHLAINLRKQGKSYSQISHELQIPKSTLSAWFKGNLWSEEIKRDLIQKAQVLASPKLRLMSIANRKKWESWHVQCRSEAEEEFPGLMKDLLFVSGLMLYWGEGDKVMRNGIVRLVNSDPEMIKIFHLFLKETLKIPGDKIVFRLTLYPDLEDKVFKNIWAKILDIPMGKFRSSVFITGKHPNRRLSYGMCSIEVYSRKLKEKIFKWINLYQKEFSKKDLAMI